MLDAILLVGMGGGVDPADPRPGSNERPRIRGYMASNLVSLRVRAIATLGALLDKVVGAGSNEIRGSFDISDRIRLLDDARRRAVEDAKRKAAQYGAIVSIVEESAPSPPRPLAMRAAAGAVPAVPVEAGEMSLTARVRITWRLIACAPSRAGSYRARGNVVNFCRLVKQAASFRSQNSARHA